MAFIQDQVSFIKQSSIQIQILEGTILLDPQLHNSFKKDFYYKSIHYITKREKKIQITNFTHAHLTYNWLWSTVDFLVK